MSEISSKTKPGGTLDLDRLKLSQDFGASIGVKKATTIVPVRKPTRQEFIRVHPDENYRFSTGVFELKEEREIYLVDSDLWGELPGEITPKILLTTINRQNVLTLWPIRLPGEDGRLDNWNASAMEAANLAQSRWVRVASNMSLGGYDVFKAMSDLPEPEWPDMSMQQIMDIAFKDRLINSLEHPVIRRLRGAL
jgi:hypothetical protein